MTRYTYTDDLDEWTPDDAHWYSYFVDVENLKEYLDLSFSRSSSTEGWDYWDDSVIYDDRATWETALPDDIDWGDPGYATRIANVLEDLRDKTGLSFASLCLKILHVGRKRTKVHN